MPPKRQKPTNDVSRRLERAREEKAGGADLRNFWERLSRWLREEGSAYSVSYEAVRNYHYDRTPPMEYSVAVSRYCGVRLDWLATGEGGMTDLEERAARSLQNESGSEFQIAMQRIEEDFPALGRAPLLVKPLVMHAWHHAFVQTALRKQEAEPWAPTPESVQESASAVAKALRAPLVALDREDVLPWLPSDRLEAYIIATTQAILSVLVPPGAMDSSPAEALERLLHERKFAAMQRD